MALTKPAANKYFEDGNDGATAVMDAPAPGTTAPTSAPIAGFSPPVVPAATGGAVSNNVKKFVSIAAQYKDALPVMAMGGLPTLKAKSGFIMDDQGANLGGEITIDLKSYNYRFVATPGEEGDEAAKLLRSSYDGVTIQNDGGSMADYVKQLKADGYENAKITKRIDAVGILVSTAQAYSRVGDIVMIDIAPTSVAKFEGQLLQASVKMSQGSINEEQAGRMKFKTVPKQSGGKSWSAFDVLSG